VALAVDVVVVEEVVHSVITMVEGVMAMVHVVEVVALDLLHVDQIIGLQFQVCYLLILNAVSLKGQQIKCGPDKGCSDLTEVSIITRYGEMM
jgi:hypothetical protein